MSDHVHQHQNDDDAHHDHPEGTDKFAEANKEHFDATAKNAIDSKWIEIAKKNAEVILANFDFDEDKTVLMDFACNIGLTSRELAPYTKTIVGVDISAVAVAAFNEAAANQGLEPDEMRAVCVELKGEDGELDGLKFDVITCALSYHHFADIVGITRTLAFFLKPGGALLVIDILKPESKGDEPLFNDKYKHVVPHTHGMKKEGLQEAFDGAGLVEFAFKPVTNVNMHGMEAILFIAKGIKPLA